MVRAIAWIALVLGAAALTRGTVHADDLTVGDKAPSFEATDDLAAPIEPLGLDGGELPTAGPERENVVRHVEGGGATRCPTWRWISSRSRRVSIPWNRAATYGAPTWPASAEWASA